MVDIPLLFPAPDKADILDTVDRVLLPDRASVADTVGMEVAADKVPVPGRLDMEAAPDRASVADKALVPGTVSVEGRAPVPGTVDKVPVQVPVLSPVQALLQEEELVQVLEQVTVLQSPPVILPVLLHRLRHQQNYAYEIQIHWQHLLQRSQALHYQIQFHRSDGHGTLPVVPVYFPRSLPVLPYIYSLHPQRRTECDVHGSHLPIVRTEDGHCFRS